MARLKGFEVAEFARKAGFRGDALVRAVAIARAESAWDPGAHCDSCAGVTEDSRGLWQINVRAHPSYDPKKLFDPAYNAKAAWSISGHGTNFKPWSTYLHGTYKQYLDEAQEAAAAVASAHLPGSGDDPSPAETSPLKKEPHGTHTVRSGETLSGIAKAEYGDAGAWRVIYDANRAKIGPNPNLISVGQKLTIPTRGTSERVHVVKAGETLFSIAGHFYGKPGAWPIIYRANRATIGPDPDKIQIGQHLVIPS
jgi:LysM repeat protein